MNMQNSKPISIVIITYNRPADLLELVKNICTLDHKQLLHEVIIVNNNSTTDYDEAEKAMANCKDVQFNYLKLSENLGVSRGRNYAIQQSSSPILLFIDDDAVFQDRDALPHVHSMFATQTESPERPVGIAAFKVLYYATHQMQQNAFPHKNFSQKRELHSFNTYYFSGCAHAIHRSVFDHVGYYPESFFYGMEEYDLSYRTLDAGFRIVYNDDVVVLHKESPQGRLPGKDKLRGMWVNKSIVAWKYLPKKYFRTTSLLWSFEYLQKTRFDIRGFMKGWKQVKHIPTQERRSPVSDATLQYLEAVDARLHY